MLVVIWTPWVAISVVYASFLEWILHKYVMHRNLKWYSYPFKAHALTHHQTFGSGDSYHLIYDEDRHTIPMAWWNGFVLTGIASIPVAIFGYFINNPSLWIITSITVYLYYLTYEYMHWCMHLPKKRFFEKMKWYENLKERHRLHHKHMNSRNFNVVVPIADLVFGTYQAPGSE